MSTNAEPGTNPTAPPTEPSATPPPSESGVTIPKVRFDEVNERMKAAEAELAKAKAERAKADEERLAADKKFEDLAAKRATERDEWKDKAEAAVERVTAMETRLHAIADERIKNLPEKSRARVPAADTADPLARLTKIEEIEELLAELPNASPPPGNGRPPKPAGMADPAKVADDVRQKLLQRGGYSF